jgi:hypothetical protein
MRAMSVAAKADLARAGVDQAHDAARDRGFAGTGLADDAERLTAAQLEVDVLRGAHLAPAAEPAARRIGFAQLAGLQHHVGTGLHLTRQGPERGNRADEHACVFVLRALEHLVARAKLHQLAQAQHRHAVRDLGHHAEVVGDEQHARAVACLQFRDQAQDLRLRGDIQRRGRLVGDQQRRIEHQRHRDHDALALAARELVRVGGHHALRIGQRDLADDVENPFSSVRRIQAGMKPQHFVDLVAAGHDRVQRGHRLLEDHRHARGAQLAQPGFGRVSDVFIQQGNSPAHDRQVAGQQAHHALRDHRLARARFSDQADDLAPAYRERNARDGMGSLRSLGKSDAQGIQFKNSAHTRFAIFGSSVSRMPSPRMLTARTVTARKTPGKKMLCG